jgi:polyhydroxybutyrate depolymerase
MPVGNQVRHLIVGKLSREYLLHIPPGMSDDQAAPVIIGYHGGGARADGFAAVTDLREVAGRRGFVTAFPVGYQRSWNAGVWGGAAKRDGVDDIAFTAAVLADIVKVVSVDPRRVYLAGWSNGGIMAFRVACELADRIAAVAVVGGGLGGDCAPVRPIPILLFHGTADTFSPYLGGEGTDPVARGAIQLGAPETARRWAKINGCSETPAVTYQKGSARAVRYTGCSDTNTVTLVTIEGMGHQWPGHTIDPNLPGLPDYLRRLGPGTHDVDATEEIVSFFSSH